MGTLAGKTALVTGGSRGIGRGIAERLGRDGARVGVHYGSNEAAAKEVVHAIESAGGQAFAFGAELGVPGDAEALWREFDKHAEGLDILVNNAGVGLMAPIAEVSEADYDRIFAINTKAPFFIAKQGLGRLRDGGRIINIATGLTRGAGFPDTITYTMTKGALDAFTAKLAIALGPRKITVNGVGPGVVDTDLNAEWLRAGEEPKQMVAGFSPLSQVAEPAEVADIVGFLASGDSRWITGQWIDATGGALL